MIRTSPRGGGGLAGQAVDSIEALRTTVSWSISRIRSAASRLKPSIEKRTSSSPASGRLADRADRQAVGVVDFRGRIEAVRRTIFSSGDPSTARSAGRPEDHPPAAGLLGDLRQTTSGMSCGLRVTCFCRRNRQELLQRIVVSSSMTRECSQCSSWDFPDDDGTLPDRLRVAAGQGLQGAGGGPQVLAHHVAGRCARPSARTCWRSARPACGRPPAGRSPRTRHRARPSAGPRGCWIARAEHHRQDDQAGSITLCTPLESFPDISQLRRRVDRATPHPIHQRHPGFLIELPRGRSRSRGSSASTAV